MNQHTPPSAKDIEDALGLSTGTRRGRSLKRVMWAAVLVALLAAAGYYWFGGSSTQNAITYETKPVTVQDVVVTVAATGTIEPITQVDVGTQLSGVVAEVRVDENSFVKKGDVLAVLDAGRLSAQRASIAAKLKMAEATLNEAKATLTEQNKILDRQKALGIRGVASTQTVDSAVATAARAEAAVQSAAAQVTATTADLAVLDSDLANTAIVTPIDGIVLKREAEPGQTVAASLQAPVLFQIAEDLHRIQLKANVDEADMGQVKQGQEAQFTVDAYRDRKFPAKIERLSYAPQTVDGVVTYASILSAANEQLELRPGMTATAYITVASFTQKRVVPNEALRFKPPEQAAQKSFSITSLFLPRMPRAGQPKSEAAKDAARKIYVLRGTEVVEVDVKTGASDGKVTIVESDALQASDAVIIAQKQTRK
jgi:HlyD family secretion protein